MWRLTVRSVVIDLEKHDYDLAMSILRDMPDFHVAPTAGERRRAIKGTFSAMVGSAFRTFVCVCVLSSIIFYFIPSTAAGYISIGIAAIACLFLFDQLGMDWQRYQDILELETRPRRQSLAEQIVDKVRKQKK